MIGGYFKLDKDLTKKGKYVCTKIVGSYKGLEYFRNRRGEIVLFLSEARSFVNANPKRQAQWALVNKINFSSIFTFNNENQGFIIGYGNPNKSEIVKGKPNPLALYKNDLYLFLVSKDLLTIEILIIPEGINHSIHYFNELLTGKYDFEIEGFRKSI